MSLDPKKIAGSPRLVTCANCGVDYEPEGQHWACPHKLYPMRREFVETRVCQSGDPNSPPLDLSKDPLPMVNEVCWGEPRMKKTYDYAASMKMMCENLGVPYRVFEPLSTPTSNLWAQLYHAAAEVHKLERKCSELDSLCGTILATLGIKANQDNILKEGETKISVLKLIAQWEKRYREIQGVKNEQKRKGISKEQWNKILKEASILRYDAAEQNVQAFQGTEGKQKTEG